MREYEFKELSQLKDLITMEFENLEKEKRSYRGNRRQLVKDFIKQNIDDNSLIQFSRNNVGLSKNPPHIIPFSFNEAYIIKYNLIELLSE